MIEVLNWLVADWYNAIVAVAIVALFKPVLIEVKVGETYIENVIDEKGKDETEN